MSAAAASGSGQVLFFDARFMPNVPLLLTLSPGKFAYRASDSEISRIPVCMVTESVSTSIRPGDMICSINGIPTINTHHHWLGGKQPHNVVLQLLKEQQDLPKTIRFMRYADANVLAQNTVIHFDNDEVLRQIFDDRKATPWDNDFAGFGVMSIGDGMSGRAENGRMVGGSETKDGSISFLGNGSFGLNSTNIDDPFSQKISQTMSPLAPVTTKEQYARAMFFEVTFPLDRTSVGLSLDAEEVEYNRELTNEQRLFHCAKVLESSVSAQVRPGDLVIKLNGQPLININYVIMTTTEKLAYLQKLAYMITNASKPKTITFLRPMLARPSVHFDTPTMQLTKHDEDVLFTNVSSSDTLPIPPSSATASSSASALSSTRVPKPLIPPGFPPKNPGFDRNVGGTRTSSNNVGSSGTGRSTSPSGLGYVVELPTGRSKSPGGRGFVGDLRTGRSRSPGGRGISGSNFDNDTFSSAQVFSVSHRTPGPMGLQMMPITISFVSEATSGMMPSLMIACVITGSTKISNIQAGDVMVNLNGGPPLLAQGSNGDGHVISVATMLSKTRPATLKLFRCAKISAGTSEVQLTAEERAVFFS